MARLEMTGHSFVVLIQK